MKREGCGGHKMQTFGANNSLYSILREQWFLFCLVTNSNYTIKLCPIKSFLGMFGFCILIAVMKMVLLIHLKDESLLPPQSPSANVFTQ